LSPISTFEKLNRFSLNWVKYVVKSKSKAVISGFHAQ